MRIAKRILGMGLVLLFITACTAMQPEPGTASTPLPATPEADTSAPTTTADTACTADSSQFIAAARQESASAGTLPNGRPFPGKAVNRREPPGRPPRNEVMIQFTLASSQQERNQYIQSIGGRSRRQIDKLNTYAVTLAPNANPDALPASPVVLLVEPDYIASALQVDDPFYEQQWSLPVVGLPRTWQVLPQNLRPVTVAVIDSGVCANHPDLSGRLLAGYDFVQGDATPQDEFGHGCSVAGIIAAQQNNGLGIAGVAPNAQIMPLRVLDGTGSGSYSAIAEAIVYAADEGAEVLNLSLAGTFYSEVMAGAVAYALERNVQIIAASGNMGTDTPYYPAAFPGVIAVGSIDPSLERSDFSNYGAHVRTLAPGRDILTTMNNGGYDFQTGTSFAAPIVAGLTAISRATGDAVEQMDNIVYVAPDTACP